MSVFSVGGAVGNVWESQLGGKDAVGIRECMGQPLLRKYQTVSKEEMVKNPSEFHSGRCRAAVFCF